MDLLWGNITYDVKTYDKINCKTWYGLISMRLCGLNTGNDSYDVTTYNKIDLRSY